MITIEFLRQFRIGGYAFFDLSVSFAGVYLLAPILSNLFHRVKIDISRKSWLFLTLPIGIGVHLLIGQRTLMTRNFMDLYGHYGLKILIIGLLLLGIKDIKVTKKITSKKNK